MKDSVEVDINYQSLIPKLRYFYNQVKFVTNNPEFKIELNTEIAKKLATEYLTPIPNDTGTLIKTVTNEVFLHTAESQSSGTVNEDGKHFAFGWIDESGIHYAPYVIITRPKKKYLEMDSFKKVTIKPEKGRQYKENRFYYAQYWSDKNELGWNPAERVERYHIAEKVLIDELFNGKAGLKEVFPLGYTKKNRYILNLGDVHSG